MHQRSLCRVEREGEGGWVGVVRVEKRGGEGGLTL
jgi:hypothetical protein